MTSRPQHKLICNIRKHHQICGFERVIFEYLNIFSQISSQIFSCGFNSGEYGVRRMQYDVGGDAAHAGLYAGVNWDGTRLPSCAVNHNRAVCE